MFLYKFSSSQPPWAILQLWSTKSCSHAAADLNLTVQTHRLLLDAQEHTLGAAVHASRPLPVHLAVLLKQTAALSAAEGNWAHQLGPVQVTIQASLYNVGDVQLADCGSASQSPGREYPAPASGPETLWLCYITADGRGGSDRKGGDRGLGTAWALVQEVLGGVSVVGVRFPVGPAAMVAVGGLMFGTALLAVIQGNQETGLGMGFGARFGEAIEGVKGFVVTYPVGYGAQRLPHLAVCRRAWQLSVVVKSTSIKFWEGRAASCDTRDGPPQVPGAGCSSPWGPDETVGAGRLTKSFH